MTPNVEAALHLCALLASLPEGTAIAAGDLAEFHDLSSTGTPKLLQRLADAGVLDSKAGRAGGYMLARSPQDLTIGDIVRAAGGSAPNFQCQKIRQQGPCAGAPSAYSSRCTIARLMDDAERAWWTTLEDETLATLTTSLGRQLDPGVRHRSREWLTERAR